MKTICIDFDGVIHKYSKGWHDGSIYDPPIEGCQLVLKRLRRAGYWIVIYTTRGSSRIIDGQHQLGQYEQLRDYLVKHKIPYDEIFTGEKPMYFALIDDRAVRFDPKPSWWKRLFGLRNAWAICEDQLEKFGILKPGEGEEP